METDGVGAKAAQVVSCVQLVPDTSVSSTKA